MSEVSPLAGRVLLSRIVEVEHSKLETSEEYTPVPGLSRGLVMASAVEAVLVGDMLVYETHAANGFKVGEDPFLSVELRHIVGVLDRPQGVVVSS